MNTEYIPNKYNGWILSTTSKIDFSRFEGVGGAIQFSYPQKGDVEERVSSKYEKMNGSSNERGRIMNFEETFTFVLAVICVLNIIPHTLFFDMTHNVNVVFFICFVFCCENLRH